MTKKDLICNFNQLGDLKDIALNDLLGERNANIVVDFLSSMTITDIAIKYNVSNTAIYDVCSRAVRKIDSYKKSVENPLYSLSTQTRNTLLRAGVKRLEDLNKPEFAYKNIRVFGKKSLLEVIECCDKNNIDCSNFIKGQIK